MKFISVHNVELIQFNIFSHHGYRKQCYFRRRKRSRARLEEFRTTAAKTFLFKKIHFFTETAYWLIAFHEINHIVLRLRIMVPYMQAEGFPVSSRIPMTKKITSSTSPHQQNILI